LKRYLVFGGVVSHMKGFKEVGKEQSQVDAGADSSAIGVSFQHEGFCRVTQGFLTFWAPTCLPFPKNPVQVWVANLKSSWLRIAGVVSRSHRSAPQSLQYCCHQRQLVALMAVSTVALSSAAHAASKSHCRAARAVG
jgi:hypothetical protein